MTFDVDGGSHRRAVRVDAPSRVCSGFATIVPGVTVAGVAVKGFVPDLVYDDLAHLVSADPGNATGNDADDGGKRTSQTNFSCKFGDPANAILITVEWELAQTLMPVHALVMAEAATEPLLRDFFLPKAETGLPAGAVPDVTPQVSFLSAAGVRICTSPSEKPSSRTCLD